MIGIEIAENILFIEGENKGRYPRSNSMLIDSDVRVLIDTGMGTNLATTIEKERKIDLVINSHGHEDHIACNHVFKNARISSHKLDASLIKSVRKLAELYPTSVEFQRKSMDLLLEQFGLRDSAVDLEFEEGYIFDLGKLKLKVIHTPGHSLGHCCFSIPSEKLIFLADIDLSFFGPWYGCLNCDIDQFIDSIKRVRALKFETAITSHKGIIRGEEIIEEELSRYLNRIFEREKELLRFLNKERSIDEIVSKAIIYGHFPEPKAIFKLFERTMIEKHLERLIKRNLVKHMRKRFKKIL
jgi:glyoxylase-like metal-dependent hydrolase (beta-lactamase superfamily II)